MRVRSFKTAFLVTYVVLLIIFVRKQWYLSRMLMVMEGTLDSVQLIHEKLTIDLDVITKTRREILQKLSSQHHQLRKLLEHSRKNFIRIKGIPEKEEENLEEKVRKNFEPVYIGVCRRLRVD